MDSRQRWQALSEKILMVLIQHPKFNIDRFVIDERYRGCVIDAATDAAKDFNRSTTII